MAQFTVTEEMFVAASKLGMTSAAKLAPFLLMVCGVIGFGSYVFLPVDNSPLELILPITLFSAGVFALWSQRNRPYKLYAQSAGFHEPFHLNISEDGINWKTSRGTWNQPWSDFMKHKESTDLFLLYVNKAIFHVVDKQALSEQELSIFHAHLK